MTALSYTNASIGEKNTAAAPKIDAALAAILAWANGNVDSANLKAGGVEEASLSTAVRTLINAKISGLSVVPHATSATAKSGELCLVTETSTITLPAAVLNAIVGVTCTHGEVTVTAPAGGIYGDFVNGATSVKLALNQHVTVLSDGTNWFIFAGEPKRETKYQTKELGTLPAAAYETTVLSATRPATATVLITNEESGPITVRVGEEEIAVLPVSKVAGRTPVTVEVPAGVALEVNGAVANIKYKIRYLLR